MVNGRSGYISAIAQALLAQVLITREDAGADDIPLAAVSALVSALALLMLLPPGVTVSFAVSRTIGRSGRAAVLTACAGDCFGH